MEPAFLCLNKQYSSPRPHLFSSRNIHIQSWDIFTVGPLNKAEYQREIFDSAALIPVYIATS